MLSGEDVILMECSWWNHGMPPCSQGCSFNVDRGGNLGVSGRL